MKKHKGCNINMKKFIALIIALLCAFAVSACGGGSDENHGELTVEQIQNDPHSFLGEIVLTGVVGEVSSREFTLTNRTATFGVTVDYRGSQAFPQIGDEVAVEGRLTENRSCCSPGFTLTSTHFTYVEK